MTREEAIESLRGILTEAVEFENSVCYVTEEDREPLEMAIKALEQEPKTGHWIPQEMETYIDGKLKHWKAYKCNKCDNLLTDDYEYCPNCGARMFEPQESEEV